MLLTIRALKATISLGVCLCFVSAFGAGRDEQQILDLTKQLIPKNHSLGVPGQSVSGTLAKPTKKGYELPVRLTVRRLRMRGKFVELELLLTNSSETLIHVPSCLDGLKAFQSGTTNHRSMEFGLSVEPPSAAIFESIEVTFGSSLSACSTSLHPGGSLVVILNAVCPEQILAIGKKSEHLAVRAFVAEATFEDARYYIKDRSERVESPIFETSFKE